MKRVLFFLALVFVSTPILAHDVPADSDVDESIKVLQELLATPEGTDKRLKIIADLEKSLARLRTSLAQAEQHANQLGAEEIGGRADAEEAQEQVAIINAKLKDLKTKIEEAHAARDAALAGQEKLQWELKAADDKIAELEKEIAALKQQAQDWSNEIAVLRKINEDLQARIKELNDTREAYKTELENLKARLAEAQTTMDTAKELEEKLREAIKLTESQSDFLKKVREKLEGRDGFELRDDRFIIDSTVLFASGSAELGTMGQVALEGLPEIINSLETDLTDAPDNWIVRVDGHTDNRPISTEQFPSNWELSVARAVAVVRYLVSKDVLPNRLGATGFGEQHPVAGDDTAEALAKNRRIEFVFTRR